MTGPLKTPLFAAHEAAGARIIDFGGWQMPVQYKLGIKKEHTWVRTSVGLFDVSHMGEVALRGEHAGKAVQRVITNDLGKLHDGGALYTVMCYPNGGIVDDCIVYRRSEREFLIVLNAANTRKDIDWLRDNVGSTCDIEDESAATALIAVQGPKAVSLVDSQTDADASAIARFSFANITVAGVPCMAARTGYTGEDGFELACAADRATELWNRLLAARSGQDAAQPIGLGARDTLRLEARLSLYGNDIDETTTPYEAGLGWVVKPDAGDFIGKPALLQQKAVGIERTLVGFRLDGRGIARHGYPIVDRSLSTPVIGRVTSGTVGITVGGAIGLGYVPVSRSKSKSEAEPARIIIDCRGNDVPATLVKGPFYRRPASGSTQQPKV